MTKFLLISICLIQLMFSSAHKDTPIELKKDGTLVGLPEKYSPAHFDRTNFVLSIANNRIAIPDCIKDYFSDASDYNIYFASSWYHDPELLPHYIHMDIISSDEYKIFFDLNTLEIFEIWRPGLIINRKGENLFNPNTQEISKECLLAVKKSITKI